MNEKLANNITISNTQTVYAKTDNDRLGYLEY